MRRWVCAVPAALLATLTGCSSSAHPLVAERLGHLIPIAERKAVSFHGTLLNGARLSSGSDRGRVLVVNFWASWCGSCQSETPQFVRESHQFSTAEVEFIGVNTLDERAAATAFVKDNHVDYPTVFDENGAVAAQMGGLPDNDLPNTLLIDKHGRAAGVYPGEMTTADLTPMIDELLSEN